MGAAEARVKNTRRPVSPGVSGARQDCRRKRFSSKIGEPDMAPEREAPKGGNDTSRIGFAGTGTFGTQIGGRLTRAGGEAREADAAVPGGELSDAPVSGRPPMQERSGEAPCDGPIEGYPDRVVSNSLDFVNPVDAASRSPKHGG